MKGMDRLFRLHPPVRILGYQHVYMEALLSEGCYQTSYQYDTSGFGNRPRPGPAKSIFGRYTWGPARTVKWMYHAKGRGTTV